MKRTIIWFITFKILSIFIFVLIYNYINFEEIRIIKKKKSDLNIYNLRINHLKNPLGIDIKDNCFSFLSDEEGPFRASIILNNRIIESKIVTLENNHCFYFNKPLQYNKKYKFIVNTDTTKNELEFETAIKLNAPFIKPENKEIFSPIFVKKFEIKNKIKKARLYITGLGLYQAYINNKKVGNAYLTPGFNDYDYYLRYQTYDIIHLLREEENTIEVHMGDGWYKGRFGIHFLDNIFGAEYKLCLHILIEYKNGETLNILSDNTWNVKSSKEISNSIYDGENVDYTLKDKPLEKVIISKENYNLIPDFGALIVEKEILIPELYISPKGEKILDFKQNMVGFVRFKGFLKKDQELEMSHGEVLERGNFYNRNLGLARQILKFKGDGEKRVYEPKFTYFGFRYVLIKGLDEVVPKDFEGVVIYSNLEKTVDFKTDDEKLNKLMQNAYWSQKGNFLDIPTDCPQRAERLGWTGDTQIFSNTACYNLDSYIFYKKFMNDIRGDQTMYYEGDIPSFSPSLKQQARIGGSVWADAGTIVPWNIYLNYGDKNLLNRFYPMMKDYVEVLIKKDISQGKGNLLLEGFTYGDWLALDGRDRNYNEGGTDNGFIMSVYYYHSVDLLSKAANELGKKKDFEKYNKLKNKIYDAILEHFFTKEGKLKLDTQTSYILCLYYEIYINKKIIINDFRNRIKRDLFHLKTGFIGSPLILLTLFDNNLDDLAYKILFKEDFPGWLYSINLNATTIWERWDSLFPDGNINYFPLNSFNHYSFGSVCEAIYSRIAGLRNLSPGWKKVLIKPQINYRLKSFNFSFDSVSGKYEISWKWKDNKFTMKVIIPNGCEAEIILPNGVSLKNITKGKHKYRSEVPKPIYSPFSIHEPMIDILKNNEGSQTIKQLLPELHSLAMKGNEYFKTESIFITNLTNHLNYTKELLDKCNEELMKIKP